MSKRVFLKPVKEARVLSGHPWVFQSDIDRAEKDVINGDVVSVISARGRPLGQAVYNGKSLITLRMLTTGDERVTPELIKSRVVTAVSLRRQLGDMNACRLINAEADGLPAVIVDKFSDVLSVQILSLGMAGFQNEIIETLIQELQPKGIWERNDVPVRELEGMKQQTGLLYGEVPERVEIIENGLKMLVDVKGGQKTGYFLDQKENRAALKPYCEGARMLDICTHTGSFALHAAMYGAREVTAVDISEHALACAWENAQLNKFSQVNFVLANAFDYLRNKSDRGEKYDLIVLDPPAFAKNKASLPGAVKGYKEINLRAMKMLDKGGILVTCSCSQNMVPDLFQKTILEASRDARVTIQQLEWRGAGKDHPSLPASGETHYLKCGIFRVLR